MAEQLPDRDDTSRLAFELVEVLRHLAVQLNLTDLDQLQRYWPIEEIKAAVDATAKAQGRSAGDAIEDSGLDPEEYWNLGQANLRAGRRADDPR